MSIRLAPIRAFGLLALAALPAMPGSVYLQTNLVSDLSGMALFQDADLVNPWGLSSSAMSPWWVSDNGTGVSTIYTGAGVKQGLVVTIPPPTGGMPPSTPTGQLFNTTSDFKVGGTKANFIFAAEDGTISAWNGGTSATLVADNSGSGAVYKGLALGNNGSGNLLYAANFNSGKIDVFDSAFAPTTVSGGFTDAGIPSGYAPFNIENIDGNLYVTYALQDADKHDDVPGPGNGYVDVFDANGNLLQRLISQGPLNSPWGMALAPSNFGSFSNDLLIGNFGDGTINVFDPTVGTFLGDLTDANGNPIVIPGLWGLAFGNGAAAGPTNSLYFTAGIPGPDNIEDHGLFGDINSVPEPGTLAMLACAGGLIAAFRLRKRIAAGQRRA